MQTKEAFLCSQSYMSFIKRTQRRVAANLIDITSLRSDCKLKYLYLCGEINVENNSPHSLIHL